MICPHCNKLIRRTNYRLLILKELSKPRTVTELRELTGSISFGTIAYHLKTLQEEGFIIREERKSKTRKGKEIVYMLNEVKLR